MVATALLLLPLCACEQDQPKPVTPPINPGSKELPLKVWVVLGATANETIGRRQNGGGRLTAAEMSQYITELQANANFFESGTMFPWDGQFNVVNFTGLIIFPLSTGIGVVISRNLRRK
ncbi:MAG: hypothetical protein ACE5F9_11450 [Phycisphaerae bacterium]